MYTAFWLLAFLLNCQGFFFVSSDHVLDDPSPMDQLRRSMKPLALARRTAPKIGNVESPFVGSKAYAKGSRKMGRRIRSENEPALIVEERELGGRSHKFCDMFGCHTCKIPDGAKCCKGFKYDSKTNKCRQLVKKDDSIMTEY